VVQFPARYAVHQLGEASGPKAIPSAAAAV
jgi:hypothetical protein